MRYATPDIEVVIESSHPATVRSPDVLAMSESLFLLTTYTLVGNGYEIVEKSTGPVLVAEPATVAVDVSRLIQRDCPTRAL